MSVYMRIAKAVCDIANERPLWAGFGDELIREIKSRTGLPAEVIESALFDRFMTSVLSDMGVQFEHGDLNE